MALLRGEWAGPRPTRPKPSSWRRTPTAWCSPRPFGDADAEGTARSGRTRPAMFDWIGLYAALYNFEGLADHIIADTKERYECLASRTP